MTAFHEVRLPLRLGFGSTGGVERRTEVATMASGFEQRSTPWANGRRRWLIGQAIRSLDEAAALTAFFEARRGRLHGFRFRDPADCRSCAPSATPGPLDQTIGTGDGTRTTFQLSKAYGDVARTIVKPVEESVRVAVDGEETSASVDTTTGVVVLEVPPAPGASVTAGFLFEVPVRFDSDRLEITHEGFAAGRVVAVPLIEIRV